MTNTKFMAVVVKIYIEKWYPYLVISQLLNTNPREEIDLKVLDAPAYTKLREHPGTEGECLKNGPELSTWELS